MINIQLLILTGVIIHVILAIFLIIKWRMKMDDYDFFDVLESIGEFMIIAVGVVCVYGMIIGIWS